MAGTLITIMDAGRAALVALGNTGTNAHQIVEIGLSTAPFDSTDEGLKQLPNEHKRITTFGSENVAPDMIHITLQDDATDQYPLYGFGLYLENGVLLAAYSQGNDDEALMEKSPAAMLLLSVDLLFATIDAATLVFGDTSFANPPATTELQGVVELATQAEVDAGTDARRAITPKTAAHRYAALTGAQFQGLVTAQTPPPDDNSNKLATTQWVLSILSSVAVGQIVMEARTVARTGFLKLNGAYLNRADYPALWAYAQASGALVSDTDWTNNNFGCFSSGDGTTTFRIPELRGEFLRCWDDGRGADPSRSIGAWQATQNIQHSHGASADRASDHVHGAWTDAQGWHGHGVSDPGHSHWAPVNDSATGFGAAYGPRATTLSGTTVATTNTPPTAGSGTGISINGDGNHTHSIGIGGGGNHGHNISIQADGGTEARPRNVALLAMIRAY